MVAAGLTGAASGDSSPVKVGAAAGAEACSSAESSPSHTSMGSGAAGSGAASPAARPSPATSTTSLAGCTAAGSSVDRASRASSEEVDLSNVIPVGAQSDCGQSAAKQAKGRYGKPILVHKLKKILQLSKMQAVSIMV